MKVICMDCKREVDQNDCIELAIETENEGEYCYEYICKKCNEIFMEDVYDN